MIYVPKNLREEERLMNEFFSEPDREESVDEFIEAHASDEFKRYGKEMDKHREEMEKQGIII